MRVNMNKTIENENWNKQKAAEIAENNFSFYFSDKECIVSVDSCKDCEKSALEMAELKDKQYEQLINKMKCCGNCKYNDEGVCQEYIVQNCPHESSCLYGGNYCYWELMEEEE